MDDIDFSNEGLSSRVDSEVVEGGEPQAVEESSADQEQETGPVDEQGVEDPEVAPVESDPYEVRYQEAQKVIGRQGQELGELRKQVEALAQAQQQPVEERPVFQGRVPQTEHDLLEMAAGGDEAWEAYQFALQYAPQLLPNVIAEVQAYDPAWAEQMRLDYSQQVMQAQYGPMQQQIQQATLAQQQAHAVQQITASIPGFDQIREQVAQVVEQNPYLMGDGSAQAIQSGLEVAARLVRAEALQSQQQSLQHQSQQMRQQAAVETGTPAAAPPPSNEDPADAIRNAIFAQDKQRRETITGL